MMPSSAGDRFRISSSDARVRFELDVIGGPVRSAELKVHRFDLEVDADGWVYFGGAREAAPLPDELILRGLRDLDLRDDQALLAFVERYGADWIPFSLKSGRGFGVADPFELPSDRPARTEVERFVHIEGLRWSAALAQLLVAQWLFQDDDDLVMDLWRTTFQWKVETINDAWRYFVGALNAGLVGTHMHLKATIDGMEVGTPAITLHSALCVQLANVIAEGLPPRLCANPTCANFFVRQEGRAGPAGQHRTKTDSVIYCSKACARAVANRRYRAARSADAPADVPEAPPVQPTVTKRTKK